MTHPKSHLSTWPGSLVPASALSTTKLHCLSKPRLPTRVPTGQQAPFVLNKREAKVTETSQAIKLSGSPKFNSYNYCLATCRQHPGLLSELPTNQQASPSLAYRELENRIVGHYAPDAFLQHGSQTVGNETTIVKYFPALLLLTKGAVMDFMAHG